MKVNGCNLAKRGSQLTGQLKAARMWLAKGLKFCFQESTSMSACTVCLTERKTPSYFLHSMSLVSKRTFVALGRNAAFASNHYHHHDNTCNNRYSTLEVFVDLVIEVSTTAYDCKRSTRVYPSGSKSVQIAERQWTLSMQACSTKKHTLAMVCGRLVCSRTVTFTCTCIV